VFFLRIKAFFFFFRGFCFFNPQNCVPLYRLAKKYLQVLVQLIRNTHYMKDMKKILSIALMMAFMMPLNAQDLEAVQKAAEEARKAEQRAAEARKNAEEAAKRAEEARKNASKRSGTQTSANTMPTEEFLKLVEEQKRMKEKSLEKRAGRIGRTATDSLRWMKNQMKLRTWPRKWFVGSNLSVNFSVADNVTDHPPFRYFSDALGLGLEVYGGKYFDRKFGARIGLGVHNVKNRMDREIVDDGWRQMVNAEGKYLYTGNGFFRFTAMELYADAMFDVTGVALTNKFYPLHVHVVMGVGMMMSGKKSLKDSDMLNQLPQDENHRYIVDGSPKLVSYEGLASQSSHVGIAGRLGLMFDYRFSKALSADLELMTTFTDDKFEGIKYDEPFDILVKLSGGIRYYF
jgi:hypothetical protein